MLPLSFTKLTSRAYFYPCTSQQLNLNRVTDIWVLSQTTRGSRQGDVLERVPAYHRTPNFILKRFGLYIYDWILTQLNHTVPLLNKTVTL